MPETPTKAELSESVLSGVGAFYNTVYTAVEQLMRTSPARLLS